MELKSIAIFSSIIVFGLLESIFPFFDYQQSVMRKFLPNLVLGLVNFILHNLAIAWLFNWVWRQTNWLGLLQIIHPFWLNLCLTILICDFYTYNWHRLMHKIPLGWQAHRVHHTDQWMNVSSIYRFHIAEVFPSSLLQICLIYIFGIKPECFIIYQSAMTISLIFHHSNLALPLEIDRYLSYFIVTPNYHRSHHSQAFAEMQNNYCSLFTIWDTLFKTRYYSTDPQKIKLGLAEQTEDLDIINLLQLPTVPQT